MSETNSNTDQSLQGGDGAASAAQVGVGDKLAPALEALKQRRQAQRPQARHGEKEGFFHVGPP